MSEYIPDVDSPELFREDAQISQLMSDQEIMENIEKETGMKYTKVAFIPRKPKSPTIKYPSPSDVSKEWMWVRIYQGGRNEGIGKVDNNPLYPRYKVGYPYEFSTSERFGGVPVPHKSEIYYRHNHFVCRLRDYPWAKHLLEADERVGCKPIPSCTFPEMPPGVQIRMLGHLRSRMRDKEVCL